MNPLWVASTYPLGAPQEFQRTTAAAAIASFRTPDLDGIERHVSGWNVRETPALQQNLYGFPFLNGGCDRIED